MSQWARFFFCMCNFLIFPLLAWPSDEYWTFWWEHIHTHTENILLQSNPPILRFFICGYSCSRRAASFGNETHVIPIGILIPHSYYNILSLSLLHSRFCFRFAPWAMADGYRKLNLIFFFTLFIPCIVDNQITIYNPTKCTILFSKVLYYNM
jgi:hypothetical protein